MAVAVIGDPGAVLKFNRVQVRFAGRGAERVGVQPAHHLSMGEIAFGAGQYHLSPCPQGPPAYVISAHLGRTWELAVGYFPQCDLDFTILMVQLNEGAEADQLDQFSVQLGLFMTHSEIIRMLSIDISPR